MQVYKITNLINNKCYIGITRNNFRQRYNYKDDWWNTKSINILLKNSAIARKKPIKCLDLNGNIVKLYNGIIDTKIDGFNPSQVALCCKYPLKHKTHRNFRWEYIK